MILVLGLLAFTFLNPLFGSWIFIGFICLLEIWIVLAGRTKIQVNNKNSKYTIDEVDIIEKYHLFFQFPVIARMLSKTFSAIQLSSFIFVPYMLFSGYWIQALIVLVQYFVVPQFAVTLNPQHFLTDNLSNNRIKDQKYRRRFEVDLEVLNSALEKMYLTPTK